MFELKELDIVLVNFSIAGHNFRDRDVFIVVVWQVGLELGLEFINFNAKGVKFLLDFNCFVSNDVNDVLFDLINFLFSFVKSTF